MFVQTFFFLFFLCPWLHTCACKLIIYTIYVRTTFFFFCVCVSVICVCTMYIMTLVHTNGSYIYVCVRARASACRFVDRLDCMQDYKHKTPFGQCITSTLIDVKSSSNPTLQFCLYFVNWKVENITKRCINYH